MKVTHLITSLEGGGTENFLHQMLAHSPKEFSHEVIYLKNNGPIGARIQELKIPVLRISNLLALRSRLKKDRPDVLHTLLFRANQMGRLLGHSAGVPWIVSSQRSIDAWQKPWHRAMDAWTLHFSHAVVANSSAAAQLVEARKNHRALPLITAIPNGIDPQRFKTHDPAKSRNLMGLPTTGILAGTLMRLHEEKGADLIPSFAEILLPRHPNLHLVIGGVGPLEKFLKEETSGKPWSTRLHWRGWVEDTPTFLSSLDLFWLLSREESFPQTLVEASAAGLPWAAPDVGGIRELKLEKSSVIFTSGNAQMAAETVAFIVNSLPLYRQNATQRAPEVQSKYDIAETARQFYAFLRYNRSNFA